MNCGVGDYINLSFIYITINYHLSVGYVPYIIYFCIVYIISLKISTVAVCKHRCEIFIVVNYETCFVFLRTKSLKYQGQSSERSQERKKSIYKCTNITKVIIYYFHFSLIKGLFVFSFDFTYLFHESTAGLLRQLFLHSQVALSSLNQRYISLYTRGHVCFTTIGLVVVDIR